MLRRSATEPTSTRGRSLRHRITSWRGWDTRVPSPPTDVSVQVEQIWLRVVAEAERLLASSSLDSAHAASLDALISESMASLYKRAREEYNYGLRMLAEFDATGRATCEEAHAEAHRRTAAAGELNDQADNLYRAYVGIERRKTRDTLDTRLEALQDWREHTFTAQPVDLSTGLEDFRGVPRMPDPLADKDTTSDTTADHTPADTAAIKTTAINNDHLNHNPTPVGGSHE